MAARSDVSRTSSFSRRFASRLIAGVGLLSSGAAVAQLDGQLAVPLNAPDQDASCSVQSAADLKSSLLEGGTLIAICGKRGVILGHADEFHAIPNDDARAVLVDIRSQGARKVLLVSDQGQELSPLLEDVSGQIALSAGLGPMSSLGGVDIDFSSFAVDGTVAVTGHPRGSDAGRASRIDLRTQLDGVRAARRSMTK